MSNSTQHSSSPELSLEAFLRTNEVAKKALDAAKRFFKEVEEYGYVRVFTYPVFEDLIAASQLQLTLENRGITTVVDVAPIAYPDEDSPLISIDAKVSKRKAPTLEIYPTTPRVDGNNVTFWVNESNPSAVVIKLLEEFYPVKDEYKLFSIVASYVMERDVWGGLQELIVQSLMMSGMLVKDITFSLYKWKSLPICYSVAYTAIPFFLTFSANPTKACEYFRVNDLEIDDTTTINDLTKEGEDVLANFINLLLKSLENISKRKRDVIEIIFEGIELTEDAVNEYGLPKILTHGFKQGSFVFLTVADLSPFHVLSLPSLSAHYYRMEELYQKNIIFARDEVPASLLNAKLINGVGKKAVVYSFTSLPPSPTLTFRMIRDLGYASDVGTIIAFNAESKSVIPVDSIKRAGLDVGYLIRKASSLGWRLEGGSLVKEDEKGKELKALLEA